MTKQELRVIRIRNACKRGKTKFILSVSESNMLLINDSLKELIKLEESDTKTSIINNLFKTLLPYSSPTKAYYSTARIAILYRRLKNNRPAVISILNESAPSKNILVLFKIA